MRNPDDPAAWIAKADSDLLCIDNNLNDARIPWDIVGFHAQQAAEKMLKAYLVSRGEVVARTHNLIGLLDTCNALGAGFQSLRADCVSLTPYAVALRYPTDLADVSELEGREAVAAARRVYDAVRAAIAVAPPPGAP